MKVLKDLQLVDNFRVGMERLCVGAKDLRQVFIFQYGRDPKAIRLQKVSSEFLIPRDLFSVTDLLILSLSYSRILNS